VSTSTSITFAPLDGAPGHRLQRLYIGRGNTLHADPPAGSGSIASDRRGAFTFVHTFDADTVLRGALVLTCSMDAASVKRGRFCASLSRRVSPGPAHRHEADQLLPCTTAYLREPDHACCGIMQAISLTMTTRPTVFGAGDQLVLRLTLAAPRGSDAVMHGVMRFGASAPGVLAFSVGAVAPDQSGQGLP
jgi:hypothetical protein